MVDEHRTPRRFWTDAISIACYISNRIFLRSILHLTPFELRFGRIHPPPPLVAFSGPSFSPPFFAAKAEQVAATAHRRLATDSTRHQPIPPSQRIPMS
jgi:hypothetical protein